MVSLNLSINLVKSDILKFEIFNFTKYRCHSPFVQ